MEKMKKYGCVSDGNLIKPTSGKIISNTINLNRYISIIEYLIDFKLSFFFLVFRSKL